MISNNLSMINELRPAAEGLAAQVALFLAAGGEIHEPKPTVWKSSKSAEERRQPPNFQSHQVRIDSREQVARIKEYGKTMTRDQICEKEGIKRKVLLGIAQRHAITFVSAMCNGGNATKANKHDPVREAMLVAKIRDCLSQNMSRKRCYETIHISSTLFHRLIKDHGIDYPTLQSAFR